MICKQVLILAGKWNYLLLTTIGVFELENIFNTSQNITNLTYLGTIC